MKKLSVSLIIIFISSCSDPVEDSVEDPKLILELTDLGTKLSLSNSEWIRWFYWGNSSNILFVQSEPGQELWKLDLASKSGELIDHGLLIGLTADRKNLLYANDGYHSINLFDGSISFILAPEENQSTILNIYGDNMILW